MWGQVGLLRLPTGHHPDARRGLRAEQRQHAGIFQLGIDETDPLPGVHEQVRNPRTGGVGADDQPRRQIRQHRGRVAICLEERIEAARDGPVVCDDEKVARAPEAPSREVHRADECAALIGDRVLRVVFAVGTVVAPDTHPDGFEQQAEQPQAGPVFRATSQQRLHTHATPHRRLEGVDDAPVVALARRENQPPARRGNQLHHRLPAIGRSREDPVGRCHGFLFDASQETDVIPIDPPLTSSALTSAIDVSRLITAR